MAKRAPSRKAPKKDSAKAAPAPPKSPAKRTTPTAPAPEPHKPPRPRLMVSVSGIRGIAGDTLDAATVVQYVRAFGELIGGDRIVLGHDARPSSLWLKPVAIGTLQSIGIDVIDVGLCPTPTIGLLTRKLRCAGGLAITASHNPVEYNGLKFFHSAGEFFTPDMLPALRKALEHPVDPTGRIGKCEALPEAVELHINVLTQAFPPPERRRASKAPKVILDCCNSAGAVLAPDVADAYGAVFQLINSNVMKLGFPRNPEPTPENIKELCRAVVTEGADLGFAIDPDGDRLALVDENGVALGEERTFLLAADAFLSMTRKKSPLVVNLSTTMAVEDLAARYRVPVHRTAIGEANVLAGMRLHKARIGGEGNGGVIVPQVQPGRDAAVAIALILMHLQTRGDTLSAWNATIPNYYMTKDAVQLKTKSVAKALGALKRSFRREESDTTDGVKFLMADRWLHVRPSNTEPIVRIFAEAHTAEDAAELVDRARALLQ